MIESALTRLLPLKYPCFQGGMAWIADGVLAAAAANAGAAGLIAAGSAPVDAVREEIAKARAATNGVFGLNIMLMSPSASDIAQLVLDEGIRLVTTGAGSPAKYLPAWKEAGVTVVPVIASVAQAQKMERLGADAVVAEGMEAGGHIGSSTTMTLVPQVAAAVSIPVLAAGGIADGRGAAAAFMLGASGVQLGTRLICTAECNAHPAYKQAILEAKDTGTIITGQLAGSAAARSIKNAFARQIVALERQGLKGEELETLLAGSLRRAAVDGDMKNGSIMAGQCAGMVDSIRPMADVLADVFNEAEQLMNGGIIR